MSQASRKRPRLSGSPSQVSRQGHLDSLCGLYAVINGVMLVVGDEIRRPGIRALLFHVGVERLVADDALADAVTNGVGFRQLCRVFKAVAAELERLEGLGVGYRILANRPIGAQVCIDRIETHLADDRPSAAILGVTGAIDHWTVVAAIDSKRVFLADCYGLKFFKRTSLTTNSEQLPARRHVLWPTQSLLLRRVS